MGQQKSSACDLAKTGDWDAWDYRGDSLVVRIRDTLKGIGQKLYPEGFHATKPNNAKCDEHLIGKKRNVIIRKSFWVVTFFVLAICSCTGVVNTISISLNKTAVNLEKGESIVLIATLLPKDATNKTIVWSSSDVNVVIVDQGGKVTALRGGRATITAQSDELSAKCEVTVTSAVTSLSLNKESLTLEKGASETLIATLEPEDATDKTVVWSSSDTNVVSVDQSGAVTALKGGRATITAQSGGLSAKCEVTVTSAVTSISLNKESLTLEKGASETLIATIEPEDATDKTVVWSSSDTNVVSVDQSGAVTALKKGKAIITALVDGLSAICTVTTTVSVQSITLEKTNVELEVGGAIMLYATVYPEDADEHTIKWSSSSSEIATVDSAGNVLAISKGKAIVTASAGGQTASCSIVVKQKGINLDDPEGFDNKEEEW